jgi:nitrate/TMAO reductase-like tetraheme cytochrome c subunit
VQIERLFSRRIIIAAASLLGIFFITFLVGYKPVTRNFASQDAVCIYCHIDRQQTVAMLPKQDIPHPQTVDGPPATCVDCHLPDGFISATYAYMHFASFTDLFGYSRDRVLERSGDWIPPRAAMAHRVRERLYESDSVTCRSCHIQDDIKPESKRGKQAHRKAKTTGQTCIECHYNMAHRLIELNADAIPGWQTDDTEEPADLNGTEFDLIYFADEEPIGDESDE